ncbi:MAG: flagellar motor switch protein FliN [Anaerolinea sp.]|nr:flagellar motor switch protein FliN [Anaerolinea sp.]
MDNNPAVPETSPSPSTSGVNTGSGFQANIDMLMDVPLTVTIELGRTEMSLKQALELNQGSVIELSRLAGDPIDVFVNEKLIARGEVVVVDDKFAVRITELFSNNNKGTGQGEKA